MFSSVQCCNHAAMSPIVAQIIHKHRLFINQVFLLQLQTISRKFPETYHLLQSTPCPLLASPTMFLTVCAAGRWYNSLTIATKAILNLLCKNRALRFCVH